MRRLWPGILLLGCLGLAVAGGGIEVRDAWVREGPPTASALAGYLVIENAGDTAAAVTGATSPQFDQVEFHETVIEQGMARMVPRARLEIPPGGRLHLAPGGVHLMLIGPRRVLKDGDRVRLDLTLESGERIALTLPVRRTLDAPPHHHHAH